MARLNPVTSAAELAALSGDDAWMRWYMPSLASGRLTAYHAGDSLVLITGSEERELWVVPVAGAPDDANADGCAALAAAGLLSAPGMVGIHLPRGSEQHLAPHRDLTGSVTWDFLSCEAAPPATPHEERVVDLDDLRHAEEINTLAHGSHDRVMVEAGRGTVLTWVGIRDEGGELVAAGGAERTGSDTPHLVGIVTRPDHRGQGLAAAVTARLTRRALDRFGACTLGIFADNDAARRVYRRLGYTTERRWWFLPLV